MIKVFVEFVEKENAKCAVNGSLHDIVAETIIAVKHIYKGIAEADEDAGKLFSEVVTKAFSDGIVFDDKKLLEIGKEIAEHNESDVEELKEAIAELKKLLEDM